MKPSWPAPRRAQAPQLRASPRLRVPKQGERGEREQLLALLAMAQALPLAVDVAALRARLQELG